ncbi:uncharacterized protein RJT20DRAFT_134283 [Scheffersomyces xylosifermentans]|uniref:uncharacterized protein n=1 Tax=Scheffersomyces xylosifermentans TaxID=1304137 RepID=UPI00315CE81D
MSSDFESIDSNSDDDDDDFSVVNLISGKAATGGSPKKRAVSDKKNNRHGEKKKIRLKAGVSLGNGLRKSNSSSSVPSPSISRSASPGFQKSQSPSRRTRSKVSEQRKIAEEFEFELPSIFETDAKRNQEIADRNKLLKQEISEEELKLKKEYEKVMLQKTKILEELNDNGSHGIKVYNLKDDNDLIERILKSSYRDNGYSSNRHFYFLTNVFKVERKLNTGSFKLSKFFFYDSRKYREGVIPYTSQSTVQFVNYCLLNITNIDRLKYVNKIVEEAIIHDDDDSMSDIFNYARLVGCDQRPFENATGSHLSVPMKLNQFNNNIKITLVRLAIILNLFQATAHYESNSTLYSPKSLIQIFILTTMDFNANEREFQTLKYFVQSVFTNFTNDLRDEEQKTFISNFMTILLSISTHTYGEVADSHKRIKKFDYELQFNTLRVLNIAFANCSNNRLIRIVTSLNLSFLNYSHNKTLEDTIVLELSEDRPPNGADTKTNQKTHFKSGTPERSRNSESSNNAHTPLGSDVHSEVSSESCIQSHSTTHASFRDIKSVLREMNRTDILAGLERNDYDAVNNIYLDHYKIQLLNHVILQSFEVNHKIEEDYETARKKNAIRLSGLLAEIDRLRNSVYENIRNIGYVKISHPSFSRDDLVKSVTEDYYSLNYLYNNFEKDYQLVKDDIFYESKSRETTAPRENANDGNRVFGGPLTSNSDD